MTAEELIKQFNTEYGLNKWPKTYEVDPITYANCCQYVFNHIEEYASLKYIIIYKIGLGINKGLMFKNVELILSKRMK